MMLQISHATAIERLRKIIPSCQSLNPDDISSHANQHGTSQTVTEYLDWIHVPDEQLWSLLVSGKIDSMERVTIVTDASFFRAYGPFELDGTEVDDFVRAHLSVCGECLFNGDVVLIRPETGRVDLFHHEGIVTHVATGLDKNVLADGLSRR